MNLSTYDNKDKWVSVYEDFRVKAGYATVEQGLELERLMIKSVDSLEAQSEYTNKFVSYCVKDWDGLDRDGEPIKCKLAGDELSKESMQVIANIPGFALVIMQALQSNVSPIRFKEVDKKK